MKGHIKIRSRYIRNQGIYVQFVRLHKNKIHPSPSLNQLKCLAKQIFPNRCPDCFHCFTYSDKFNGRLLMWGTRYHQVGWSIRQEGLETFPRTVKDRKTERHSRHRRTPNNLVRKSEQKLGERGWLKPQMQRFLFNLNWPVVVVVCRPGRFKHAQTIL